MVTLGLVTIILTQQSIDFTNGHPIELRTSQSSIDSIQFNTSSDE
jgi:hypothetical protein